MSALKRAARSPPHQPSVEMLALAADFLALAIGDIVQNDILADRAIEELDKAIFGLVNAAYDCCAQRTAVDELNFVCNEFGF